MTNRLLKYILLSVLAMVLPYLTTIILIIMTGDRHEGMELGAIPGLALPHLIFGMAFVRRTLTIRIPITIIMTAIIYGLFVTAINLDLVKTNFDIYGYWDLAITNLMVGLIGWELYYRTEKFIFTKKKSHEPEG